MFFIKIRLNLLMILFVLFTTGCSQDEMSLDLTSNINGSTTSLPEDNVELFEYTKVPAQEEYDGMIILENNTLEIDKSICTSLSNLEVNDVIVTAPFASAPNGLLIKVISIIDNGNKLNCKFENTNFSVAFKSLSFHRMIENNGKEIDLNDSFSNKINNRTNYTQTLGRINLTNNLVLYDHDGSNSTTHDRATMQMTGYVNPSFSIVYNMSNKINHFEVSGNIKAFIQTYMGWSMGSIKKYGLNIKRDFTNVNLPNITFWISGVPIVITPKFNIKGVLEGDIRNKIGVTNECNFNFTGRIRYLNGNWTRSVTGNSTVNNYLSYGASAKAKLKGGPELSVRFYNLDIIVGAVNAFGYMSAETHASSIGINNYNGRIRGGIEGNVEGKLDLPNIWYTEAKWTLFDLHKSLWYWK